MRIRIFFISFLLAKAAFSQTLGGNAAYNFMRLPSSPIVTAAGGVNVSYRTSEAGLSANNPSLLHRGINSQVAASFNAFLGGIKAYGLTGAHHANGINTTFGGHVYYIDYGSLPATDAAGNQSGAFRPVDFVVQLSAAREYLEKWTYGGSLKFISTSYQQYRSSAIAFDFGLFYLDSAANFSASFVAKNMGAQLKTYATEKEDLPFDLQVGITKRLAKAPLGFSLTAQHLHRFDLAYSDTTFNNENGFSSPSAFSKIFNHFVLASHIYLGKHLEATIGYNHLRRQELSVQNAGNGLTGFSAGLHIKFNKLQILYARSAYQRGVSYNQIGITAQLNKLTGL